MAHPSQRHLLAVGVVGLIILAAPNLSAIDTRFSRFTEVSGMVLVPAGPFVMGANDRGRDEAPQRRVYLDAFHIDRFEVTNEDFDRCTAAGACRKRHVHPGLDGPRQPVVGVTWADATSYCRWAGKRLPTEAEWEKAARGPNGRKFPWGDSLSCTHANYGNGAGRECPDNPGKTAEVGSFSKDVSPYGVYDMGGNAWELVADFYSASYGRGAPSSNPTGPRTGRHHVVKGGSWYTTADNVASSSRISRSLTQNPYDGFRCARTGR